VLLNGTHKPAWQAFRIPIWLPRTRHGPNVTVWGQLRPGNHQSLQYAILEYRPRGSRGFEQLRELQTSSAQGFLVAHVALPSAGELKLAWLDPAGIVEYSRTVTVS
jgi:hypothetical protein